MEAAEPHLHYFVVGEAAFERFEDHALVFRVYEIEGHATFGLLAREGEGRIVGGTRFDDLQFFVDHDDGIDGGVKNGPRLL